ncbi:DUF3010 family protein [Pseudoalteromonas piratica]|uniref:DUF3010 domain-containing protein n=1 Tax=Pseudoalteromonas piratica TaxID=1348114 RepID=A0A0A7EHI4_9GAMM|nr:DUF3010 family protein [Pseudoalteromonas piratica]AIY65462.1 hypothetical protein OM33_10110 [Pseudoalteromonas piratica]
MRTCGVEIKGSEALICVLAKENDVFDIRDVRQTRFVLPKNDDADTIRKFQFDFAKLMQDYQVDTIAIKERQQKGKFAGSPQGFKIEAALQLINDLRVVLLNPTAMKEQLKKNPLPIDFEDTGLKKFQETAFVTAYIELTHRTYNKV